MATPQEPDGLEPLLRQVEAELVQRLEEACESDVTDIRGETTGELFKLEERLHAAARAAEQAVQIRRAMRRQGRATPGESVREFTDAGGREWRAWVVIPGRVRSKEDAERYLGEYARGWLAFEALDGSARRRLPGFPENWRSLDDAGLERLMRRAPEVPVRRVVEERGGERRTDEGSA